MNRSIVTEADGNYWKIIQFGYVLVVAFYKDADSTGDGYTMPRSWILV